MTTTATIANNPHQMSFNASIDSIKFAPGGLKSRRRRRAENLKVNFPDDNLLKTDEVEHMDDLPGELIWYSREEYDDIKAKNSYIVRLIKAGEFEENDDLSCRGLEHKLKEVFRQRRANKFNALNAVLEEQDRQINRGIVDALLIASAYQTVSVRCQESANTIAFRDYRFSLNYNPDIPATGKDGTANSKLMGESNGSMTPSNNNNNKGEKKKKKKDKKKEKDKEKAKDKKDKDKNNTNGNNNNSNNNNNNKEPQDDEDEDDEEAMSPKGEKKRGKVRKMARGARRMMRRMSM